MQNLIIIVPSLWHLWALFNYFISIITFYKGGTGGEVSGKVHGSKNSKSKFRDQRLHFLQKLYDKNEKGKKRNLAEKTESKKASPFLVSFLICLLGERLTYLFTNVRIEAPWSSFIWKLNCRLVKTSLWSHEVWDIVMIMKWKQISLCFTIWTLGRGYLVGRKIMFPYLDGTRDTLFRIKWQSCWWQHCLRFMSSKWLHERRLNNLKQPQF